MKVKNDSGASALGHQWKPGQTIDLPDEQAAELFAIQDGGFYPPKDFEEIDPSETLTEIDPHLGGPNTEPLGVEAEPEEVLKDLPAPGDLVEAQTGKTESELAADAGVGEGAHDEDREAKIDEGTTPSKTPAKKASAAKKAPAKK